MQLSTATLPLEEIAADVLVFFQFADEPAPRGRLGRADWILLSALSRLTARGKFSAGPGASALLSSTGKFAADWVLVMGLGARDDLSMTALYRLSYQAAETILKLRRPRIALELPLRGFPAEPPARIREAFLEGFLAELQRGWPEAAFSVSLLPPEDGTAWPELSGRPKAEATRTRKTPRRHR